MSFREGVKNHLPSISLTLVVGVLIAIGFMVGFGREYLRNREIEQEIASLQAENDRLEGKRLEFLDLINTLSSEYYLEGEARVKQGMAKPGETLVLVDTNNAKLDERGLVLGVSDEASGISNPARWFYYFFDHGRFVEIDKL